MKVKKILIILCLFILLFAASLCGAILYFYYHPSAVRPFIERTVSRSTGTSFTIDTLSYSLKPLRVQAKGITLRAPGDEYGPHLEIPGIEADMELSGPFGHKTLTFKRLKMDRFSFQLREKTALPKIRLEGKRPSLFVRLLKGAVAFLLFRDVAFQAAELVNGRIWAEFEDKTFQVNGIYAELNSEHQIVISAGIHLKSRSQNLLFNILHVHLTTERAISLVDPEIRGTLTATNATYDGPLMLVKGLQAKAELTYSSKQKACLFESADLEAEEFSLKQGANMQWPAMPLRIKTKGFFNLQERRLETSKLELRSNDTLHLTGKLEMAFGNQTEFKYQVLDSHFLAQKILTLLPEKLKNRLPPLTMSGPLQLNGSISGLREKGEWSLHSDLQTSLKSNPITYRMGQIKLDSRVSGSILTRGKFPDVDMSVKLQGDETMISGAGIHPGPFKVGVHLSGRYPIYLFKDLSVQIPWAKLGLGKKEILVDHLEVQARNGRLDAREKAFYFPEIRLDSSLLKNLLMALELRRKRLSLNVQGEDVRLIESALALGLIPPGWQMDGKDSFKLNAALNEGGDWTFASELGFQDLGFQNPGGSAMGEKISTHMKTDGRLGVKSSQIDAKATLKVDGGEVLYNRFYLDMNSRAFLSCVKGQYDLLQKSLKLSRLEVQLKEILNLAMTGTVHFQDQEPRGHLTLNVPKTPLEPLFHHFVLEPFKTERPSLAALKLGGTIAADLNLTGTMSDWMLEGRCQWHRGELSSADRGFSFAGVELDLPIWQHYFNTPTLPSPLKGEGLDQRMKGDLSIQSLALPFLPEQSLKITLDAGPNQLSVPSPTLLKVHGGKIQLGPLLCRDIYRSQRSIETSLALDPIELGPLLTGILPRPIAGTLQGQLETVHFEGGAVRTKGDLRAEVLGGEILISGLGVSRLFTSTPLLRLNARWKDLHLGDLTRETSFGKIEGILDGYINGLEMTHGQPQKFDLLLQTVKKKGIPQRISVKAVDNIALVGGGQSPFMGLAGGFASIFREFPYEKIGIHASLENDVFRINGTIKEGGTEFLVKRGSFSGVNVVNQNPDNRISFKDMVKRVRRVTTSKSGPVVK